MRDTGSRQVWSERMLQQLKERLARFEGPDYSQLCIYVTGSFGRLEAWDESDLDLFFLYDGPEVYVDELGIRRNSLSWMGVIRLFTALADEIDELGFPPFSGDGKYLEIQYVDDMETVLGSPVDDSANSFTARMLLLLESRALLNDDVYEELLKRVIGFYFRDFADHPKDFVPTFLTNDILRFWRTLTLNYEHDRFTDSQVADSELREAAKARSALKNYKLKFSRLSTCFSMVGQLVASQAPVDERRVLDLCHQTPTERLTALGDVNGEAREIVGRLLKSYDDFLEKSQRPKDEVLADLRVQVVRRELLDEAGHFGGLVYELVRAVDSGDRMRHLVV